MQIDMKAQSSNHITFETKKNYKTQNLTEFTLNYCYKNFKIILNK